MTIARATSDAISAILTRVRDEIGDPATDHEGNSIPEGSRRWSDQRVRRSINDQLIALQVRLQGGHPEEFLVRSSPLYYPAEGADLNLSSTIGGGSIYAVYLADENGQVVRELNYVGMSELERFGSRMRTSERPTRYTITSNTAGAVILKIRPRPGGLFVVVDAVAEPVSSSSTQDIGPLSVRWQELLVLETAYALQSPDDEFGLQAMDRLQFLRAEFTKHAGRRKGVTRVQRRRRMRPLN